MNKKDYEINEYIRTKNGLIGKIDLIREKIVGIHTFDFGLTIVNKSDIELSGNIINVLKKDDYVNGHRIYEVKENCVMIGYKCFPTKFNKEEEFLYQTIYEEDIKSVETKEQFRVREYIIK